MIMGKCTNPVQHRPMYHSTVLHHVRPRVWGGGDFSENRIELCHTCHDNVHVLLDMAVKQMGWPAEYAQRFSNHVMHIAKAGWDSRPSTLTYTKA